MKVKEKKTRPAARKLKYYQPPPVSLNAQDKKKKQTEEHPIRTDNLQESPMRWNLTRYRCASPPIVEISCVILFYTG